MPSSPHTVIKRNTPSSVLQSVAAITSLRDRDLLARALTKTLSELIQSKRIAMYLISHTEQGEEAVLIAGTREKADNAFPDPEASIGIASRADFSSVCETGKVHAQALGNQTFLYIYPIIGQRGLVGLLEMVSDAHSNTNEHLILAFVKVYSNYLSILDESETDTLTGLLNRRTFDNNIEKIIAERFAPDDMQYGFGHASRRAEGANSPHWLAVMDIDHFKRINDKFGHLYGDEVLLLLSRNMQRIFRQRDKLFRFGGEEFVVVLDRTDLKSARRALERFRTAIEQYEFPQVGKVTISIGFVRLDKPDVPSSIIGRADQALYYAKEHGRNQVCFYEDLIAEGKIAKAKFSNDVQIFQEVLNKPTVYR